MNFWISAVHYHIALSYGLSAFLPLSARCERWLDLTAVPVDMTLCNGGLFTFFSSVNILLIFIW